MAINEKQQADLDKFLKARKEEQKEELKGVFNHMNHMVRNGNRGYSCDLSRLEHETLTKLHDIFSSSQQDT